MTVVTDSSTTPSIDVPVYALVQHRPTEDTGQRLQETMFATRCAQCHGAPAALGRSGGDLYAAVCVMCHPDAHALVARDDALRRLISYGDLAHNMPAYERDQSGPLSTEQIDSLVAFIGAE